ncbi:MAG: hypothetical protein V9G98_02020 [Candidatus Competibacter sp.]
MSPIKLGADYLGDRQCAFTLWAPLLKQAAVHLAAPEDRLIPMTRDEQGYWRAAVTGIEPGALYFYRWDGETDRPDPASHSQPQGVHGPSRIVDHAFAWTDARWRPPPLEQWVMYELHVGTFTRRGHFRRDHSPPAGVAGTGRERVGAAARRPVPWRAQLGL